MFGEVKLDNIRLTCYHGNFNQKTTWSRNRTRAQAVSHQSLNVTLRASERLPYVLFPVFLDVNLYLRPSHHMVFHKPEG